MPQNTGTVGAASVLASEGIELASDPTPDIPGAALLLVYSPEQRAELVEFAKSHLGGPCKRGSPAWWAIAVLTYEETLRRVEASPARIVPFDLNVCAKAGDPGCLGWPDGYHEGPCEYATAVYHQCSECKADDVYGEITHEETCSANQPKDGGFAWRLAAAYRRLDAAYSALRAEVSSLSSALREARTDSERMAQDNASLRHIVAVAVGQCQLIVDNDAQSNAGHRANLVLITAAQQATEMANRART